MSPPSTWASLSSALLSSSPYIYITLHHLTSLPLSPSSTSQTLYRLRLLIIIIIILIHNSHPHHQHHHQQQWHRHHDHHYDNMDHDYLIVLKKSSSPSNCATVVLHTSWSLMKSHCLNEKVPWSLTAFLAPPEVQTRKQTNKKQNIPCPSKLNKLR